MKRDKIENQPCSRCKHFAEYKRTHSTCGVSCIDFKSFEPCEEEERMTNEKAKDLLDNLIGVMEDNHDNDYDTALEMGIKAIALARCLELLDKYAEQEPKTQMVDKSNFDVEQYKMDLQCAYDCGKASFKPCEDAVSRETIMQHYETGELSHINFLSRNYLLDFVESLPSVHPKQKTGRWIKREDDEWYGEQGECAICGHVTIDVKNFCPNCGARMESEDADSD